LLLLPYFVELFEGVITLNKVAKGVLNWGLKKGLKEAVESKSPDAKLRLNDLAGQLNSRTRLYRSVVVVTADRREYVRYLYAVKPNTEMAAVLYGCIFIRRTGKIS
jgi:hypothetical protein